MRGSTGVRRCWRCSGSTDWLVRPYAELLETESIETLVLIARWSVFAEGLRYKHEGGDPVLIRDGQSESTGTAENRAVFARGLERTMALLQGAGKDVFIVRQVPDVGWDVPSALARSEWLGRRVLSAPTPQEHAARQGYVDELVDRLARARKVQLIHPDRVLCGQTSCRVTAHGTSLYSDNHHLSSAGAVFVSEVFEDLFRLRVPRAVGDASD